jgi:DNA-directed RNA polymerase subunit omega
MMYPRIDDLLENVSNSRYALVIAAAKRARQINNYHHQLGEGRSTTFPPPLVESRSKNYLTMALEEIGRGQDHGLAAQLAAFRGAAMARVLLGSPVDCRLQGVRALPFARKGRARSHARRHARR